MSSRYTNLDSHMHLGYSYVCVG